MKNSILAIAMLVASVSFAQEAGKPKPVAPDALPTHEQMAEKGKCGMGMRGKGMKGKGMGNGKCMKARKGQDAAKPQEGCKDCKKEVKE